jgi:hypothetical protein
MEKKYRTGQVFNTFDFCTYLTIVIDFTHLRRWWHTGGSDSLGGVLWALSAREKLH